MDILIPTGLCLFFLLSLHRREYGIYLIILLLPAYQIRFHVFNVPATFLEGMIVLLALTVSLRGVRKDDEAISIRAGLLHCVRNDRLPLIFVLLFLLAAGISVFTAPDMTHAAGIFKAYFFEAVLFYFLVRLIIDSRGKLEKLFQALALLVLYLSVFGLYQFVTLYNLPHSWWAVDVGSRRIVSLLNHPNAVALLLGPILAMLIIKQRKTRLSWAAIILGLTAFYLTLSRAGWLALIVTIAGFTILASLSWRGEGLRERSRIWKLLIPAVGIILLILAVPFSRTKLLELTNKTDPSRQNRIVLWSAAAEILKKHPVAGVGLMGFREAYKNYPLGPDRVVQNYPHNFFLNFWLETGLLGMLSMIGLLILFFRKTSLILKSPLPNPRPNDQNLVGQAPPQGEGINANSSPLRGEDKGGDEKNYSLAFAAGMTMIVLHSLVDVSYFKNDLSVLFWTIYALPNLVALQFD